jgi:DnaJ-class molecular chaperone
MIKQDSELGALKIDYMQRRDLLNAKLADKDRMLVHARRDFKAVVEGQKELLKLLVEHEDCSRCGGNGWKGVNPCDHCQQTGLEAFSHKVAL